IEILKGFLLKRDFQIAMLQSNKKDFHENLGKIQNFCQLDIVKSQKFLKIIQKADVDTLFLSLVIFSDDFGKTRHSKYHPIDCLYVASGNFPLNLRYKHE